MSIMKKFFLICFVLSFQLSSPLLFADNFNCENKVQIVNKVKVVQRPLKNNCWIIVTTDRPVNLTYRSFLFDQEGYLSVFNSLGPGPESQHTGARTFYFFPRKQDLSYSVSEDQVHVHIPHGATLIKNSIQNLWDNAIDAIVYEDPSVDFYNKGGFEINLHYGLVLDFGFTLGRSPTSNKVGEAHFVDYLGKTCKVKNSEVLYWEGSQHYLKFKTDDEVYRFVQHRCSHLSVPLND